MGSDNVVQFRVKPTAGFATSGTSRLGFLR